MVSAPRCWYRQQQRCGAAGEALTCSWLSERLRLRRGERPGRKVERKGRRRAGPRALFDVVDGHDAGSRPPRRAA